MSETRTLAATLLERSASAYAGHAASTLLERRPEIRARLGGDALDVLRAQLIDRVLELAAALHAGEPRLFRSRVVWSRQLARAREAPDDALRHGLDALAETLREELPPAAWSAAEPYVEPALAAFDQEVEEPVSALDPSRDDHRLVLEYLHAILEGDGRRARQLVLDAVADGLDVRRAYLDVLLPAQIEIGRMWHADEVTIAEEHFVTATTQTVMSILTDRARPSTVHSKTVLVAAVAGNAHSIGLRALADFFEMEGWRVIRLGSNTPTADLIRAAQFFEAELVTLSASLTIQLETLRRAVDGLRRHAARRGDASPVRILVGGLAFEEMPELWRTLGADGYAPTADEAVRLGARLVGLKKQEPADG